MSITSGYNKYKRYTKLSDGTYKLVSQWTNSNTVEMDNGSTLQATLGNTSISGIGDGTVTGAIDSLNSNLFNILPEKQLPASGDLNDLTQGFYRCIGTPSNVPPVSLTGGLTNDYGRVVVFGYTDYRIQIFFNAWGNCITWRRCSTSSGWSDWMLV